MQCPCSGDGPSNPLVLLAIFAGCWLLFNWIKKLIKSKGVSFMNKTMKIVIIVALIAVVGTVFALKQKNKGSVSEPVAAASPDSITSKESKLENSQKAETTAALPRLVDLGATKCIPCKMMKPILDELRQEYKDSFQVIFIDVWETPDEAKKSGIKIIPTQIFYDASGKELYRHEGFFSKEDILGKWKEFGINLDKGGQNESN